MNYCLNESCRVLGQVIQKPHIRFSFLAYLLTGPQNLLIDTLPERNAAALLADLDTFCPAGRLDALILTHSEEDHSGALPALLERYPGLPVYGTENCRRRLEARGVRPNFHAVPDGGSLRLGGREFRFYHTPGLHWDDNMVTFLPDEDILFSNDLFGQYLGEEPPLDDTVAPAQAEAQIRAYFEKVFAPSTPQQRAAVLPLLELHPRLIAPGHGVILQRHRDAAEAFYRARCGEKAPDLPL